MVDLDGDFRVFRWENSASRGWLNVCLTGQMVQPSLSRWVASSSNLELWYEEKKLRHCCTKLSCNWVELVVFCSCPTWVEVDVPP